MLKYTVKANYWAGLRNGRGSSVDDYAVYAPGKDGDDDMPIAVFAKQSDAREFAKWKTEQSRRKAR